MGAIGIDEVIVYCVNDGAVMSAWAKDQGLEGNKFITMMCDPAATLTKALGVELTAAGPAAKGIIGRCKRFAMYVEDGTVKFFKISEAPDDPAGDDDPSATLAPAVIKAIKQLNTKTEL